MVRHRSTDGRDDERVWNHYVVECEIAERLRSATPDERRRLYTATYDELFRRVPDHPQLREPTDGPRAGDAEDQWRFLRRFVRPQTCLLEIGSGDCALAARAARSVRHVLALDVSPTILSRSLVPANVQRTICDGVTLPVADQSVDVAYSSQLMEHLHPQDARAQLAEIHRVLVPNGTYVCITPNRLTGPHDISRRFDDQARGLHLKEYTVAELDALLREAGFTAVHAYTGTRGVFVRLPARTVSAVERLVEAMPPGLRRAFRDSALALPLLQARVAAVR
ncbi:MAG: class I SAM-dependent methyltransferase [Coriobacteriia bacterium]